MNNIDVAPGSHAMAFFLALRDDAASKARVPGTCHVSVSGKPWVQVSATVYLELMACRGDVRLARVE